MSGLFLLAVATASPTHATEGFACVWREGPVTVRWHEGNHGHMDEGVRDLVGHWKRLAVTAWAPRQTPLRIDVSLYGPGMGSETPHVHLSAAGRSVEVVSPGPDHAADATDIPLLKALTALEAETERRGNGETETNPSSLRLSVSPSLRLPFSLSRPSRAFSDDYHPRLSPDGRWCAFRTWRAGSAEVWLSSWDGRAVYRVAMPLEMPSGLPVLTPPLIDHGPEWSPVGRTLYWIQGGRLCLLDMETMAARIVTPSDTYVQRCTCSGRAGYAALDGDDGRLMILDARRRVLVPLHAALPRLVPAGDDLWSPSGRRLLFRARGGVSSANFARPSPAARWVRRALAVLTGRPRAPEPELVVGDYRERIVRYDLSEQRLDSLPLEFEPGAIERLLGAVWEPNEDIVSIGARSRDGSYALWRFRTGAMSAEAVLRSRRPLVPIAPAGRYLAVVDGDRLRLTSPDREATEPRSYRLDRYPLVPEPRFSSLDVEGEDASSKPVRSLVLVGAEETGLVVAPQRLPERVYVSLSTGSPVATALRRRLQRGGVLDVDLNSASRKVVACVSTNGGVGELIRVDASGREEPLSRALSAVTPAVLTVLATPYPVVGARSGMAMLASDPTDPRIPALYGLGAVLLIAGGLALRRRRRTR